MLTFDEFPQPAHLIVPLMVTVLSDVDAPTPLRTGDLR
jgi:hypothetical protein